MRNCVVLGLWKCYTDDYMEDIDDKHNRFGLCWNLRLWKLLHGYENLVNLEYFHFKLINVGMISTLLIWDMMQVCYILLRPSCAHLPLVGSSSRIRTVSNFYYPNPIMIDEFTTNCIWYACMGRAFSLGHSERK